MPVSRLPESTREGLSPRGQQAWDHVASTRGRVAGPYQVLIQVPPLAERIADLGTYLRFEGQLAGADRELAILVVAREIEARYEWTHHEVIARREGVRPEAIEVVLAQGSPAGLSQRERLVEMVGLAGYYTMIALVLVGYQVEDEGPRPF
jgi:4-carboxymuconolactone decarboxylase